MEPNILLLSILKDSKYNLNLFTEDEINWLVENIKEKDVKGIKKPFVDCIKRNKDIQLKPEEIVRQLYTYRLINTYKYPLKRIKFEIKSKLHLESSTQFFKLKTNFISI